MDECIINYLASMLEDYRNVVLEKYRNNVFLDCPILTDEDRDAINNASQTHIYEGQLLLKEIVGRRVHGTYNNNLLNSWIVRTWGGIRNFNAEYRIDGRSRMSLFFEALENENIPNSLMRVISSLSKIASFIFPDTYFVYDSRVAVALNGLLLRCREVNPNYIYNYFYMPHARNNRDGIMRQIIQESDPFAAYHNRNTVYFEYCNLVRLLNRKLYGTNEQPGKVEMLLFMIAKTGGAIDNWFGIQGGNNLIHTNSTIPEINDMQRITDKPIDLGSSRGFKFGYFVTIYNKRYICYVGSGKGPQGRTVKCCQIYGIEEKASLLPIEIKEGFDYKAGKGVYKIVESEEDGEQALNELMRKLHSLNY